VAGAAFVAVALWPAGEGLTPEGQRALALLAGILVLWITEALPLAVTALLTVLGLLATQPGLPTAQVLSGFSSSAVFFLLGVLGLGAAVAESGLASRIAYHWLGPVAGHPQRIYWRTVLALPVLPLVLPSALTRNAVLIPVYRDLFRGNAGMEGGAPGNPLAKAVFLVLGILNPMASSITLTGGSVSIATGSLVGGVSWGRWFLWMGLPYMALIAVGAAAVYLFTGLGRLPAGGAGERTAAEGRPGKGKGAKAGLTAPGPWTAAEKRTVAAAAGALLLWLTDWWHGWPPALPALGAFALLMIPGPGALAWDVVQRRLSWVTLLTLGAILSLVATLQATGAVDWFAARLLGILSARPLTPGAVYVLVALVTAGVHLAVPGLVANLSLLIPLVMALAPNLGVNPLAAALLVTLTTDSVILYPVQTTTNLMAYEHGHITAGDVLRLGLILLAALMALIPAAIIPYWARVGLP